MSTSCGHYNLSIGLRLGFLKTPMLCVLHLYMIILYTDYGSPYSRFRVKNFLFFILRSVSWQFYLFYWEKAAVSVFNFPMIFVIYNQETNFMHFRIHLISFRKQRLKFCCSYWRKQWEKGYLLPFKLCQTKIENWV